MKNNVSPSLKHDLIARYPFDDAEYIGKDISGNGQDLAPLGLEPPKVTEIAGRFGAEFFGGANGTGYLKCPQYILNGVSDESGLSISTWVYLKTGDNVWERIFDFGKGQAGPYLFMTRQFRSVCFNGTDIATDPNKTYPVGEWMHIVLSISPTLRGKESSAGPKVYVNGRLVGDGAISQTSSGTYKAFREWFQTVETEGVYHQNYIGKSQFDADSDFKGALSDFRIYKSALTQADVIDVMCESLDDEKIVALAKEYELVSPLKLIQQDIKLPKQLMGEKVAVEWTSSKPHVLSHQGTVKTIHQAEKVNLTATLRKGHVEKEVSYYVTVLPKDFPTHELIIEDEDNLIDVPPHMYGLFYEDINHAADGGIYAEYVQNRSFESFVFDTYDHQSGACGCSTGRNPAPLHMWFGDLDKVEIKTENNLNMHLGLEDKEINTHYVRLHDGATLINKGFTDSNHAPAMSFTSGEMYDFSVWAKANRDTVLHVSLTDGVNESISEKVSLTINGDSTWRKYQAITLIAEKTCLGQLLLQAEKTVDVDFISLMPRNVWGAKEEVGSKSAHQNYLGNPNYRLRKDLVLALKDLHPKFLRFPGGCISEGSYIWDNVYEWKDSIGEVETRKENFNVWGYMMTMGLGYMEYFQLAEDLNATPLPVMACGVLCQARSDYVHPAGGKLRDAFVKSFTDLIDFAISQDIENNPWVKIRAEMGHPQPFDLRYLGIGNENWGTELYANFAYFKAEIEQYMSAHYPDHLLTIISTVGAQADDEAFQDGWKYLAGEMPSPQEVTFTDGEKDFTELVDWYENANDFMDTIADEHYYRSNDYLLQNVDRYNYYERVYDEFGHLDEAHTPKVFVGEFASTDKNTLMGAISEAAIMTGYENNADVVRLVAYAPLFNKVLTDQTYRWTPDLIWFDNTSVWFTPNYYVQQLFSRYLGEKVLHTSVKSYEDAHMAINKPSGGISIATTTATVLVKEITVKSLVDGNTLFHQDFTETLDQRLQAIPGSVGYEQVASGLILSAQSQGQNGLYLLADWSDYEVSCKVEKIAGDTGIFLGVGLQSMQPESKTLIEYAILPDGQYTGVKVHKNGVEGYTLGDYSSSRLAGNLRRVHDDAFSCEMDYTVNVNYHGAMRTLTCQYYNDIDTSDRLVYKLDAYNNDIFTSVTKDDAYVYVKLVNAEANDKAVTLRTRHLPVQSVVETVLVTGDESIINEPNINKKEKEIIRPVFGTVDLTQTNQTVSLPKYSVLILKLARS